MPNNRKSRRVSPTKRTSKTKRTAPTKRSERARSFRINRNRKIHSTHSKDFKIGEIYYYQWATGFRTKQAVVKINKINPKSVRVQVIDPLDSGAFRGETSRVYLRDQTGNSGLFKLTPSQQSQYQEVARNQVNVRVTETKYTDRAEFRRMGLIPERDHKGKFLAWRGSVPKKYLPKLNKMGKVEKSEPYSHYQAHQDEKRRLDRRILVLESRIYKKEQPFGIPNEESEALRKEMDMLIKQRRAMEGRR
jgi:hypothetical protein